MVVAWLALIVVVLSQANHPVVRRWLAERAIARLSSALHQSVRLGDLRVTYFPPRLTVLGLEVGPEGAPALTVDLAEAVVGRFRLASRELIIDGLRVKGVRVNTAAAPTADGEAAEPWLRVVVRQLSVEDVHVDRFRLGKRVELSAGNVDLRWFGSRRTPVGGAVLHADDVLLRVPGIEPVTGSLVAWGKVTRGGWELPRMRGRGPGWNADLWARSVNGVVSGGGTGTIGLAELDRTVRIGVGFDGQVEVKWEGHELGSPARVIDARLSSNKVKVAGFVVEDIEGEAHISAEGLDTTLERALFAGGHVEGSYSLEELGAPWRHRVAVRGTGVSIESFLAQLGAGGSGLAARAVVSAELGWHGLAVKAGAGTAVADLQPEPGDVPVSGRLVVTLQRDGKLHFAARNATLAGGPVRWDGDLQLGSWLPDWSVRGQQIRVATVARLLRGWVGTEVLPPELGGEAAVDLRLRGPFQDLTVTGDVAVAPVSFGPVEADGLQGSLRVGQGVLRVESGVIVVGSGEILCEGELRYGEGGKLLVDLGGRAVPLDRIVSWAGVEAPLQGRVGLDGTLTGTLDAPIVQAVLKLRDVALAGIPFGDGEASVAVENDVVEVGKLVVGPLSAKSKIDLRSERAEVEASLVGLGLEQVSPPLARLVGGALDCSIKGVFPFSEPALRLDVSSAKGGHGVVELDGQGVRFSLERSQVWRFAGDLRRNRGGYEGTLHYAVDSWRVVAQDLLGGEVPIDGKLRGEATVRLAPPRPALLVGAIEELEVEVEGELGHLEKPAKFTIEGGVIDVPGLRMVGPRSALAVRGGRNGQGELYGAIEGEVPAALLGLVWRQADPRGRVTVRGEILGTDEQPRFEGDCTVSDGSLKIPGLPGPVTKITGDLAFIPEAIRLGEMRFTFLGGEGTASGRIALSPELELDLELRPTGLRWPLVPGFTPSITGEFRLVGPLANLSLTGRATLQHTAYRREINLQKLVMEQILSPVRAPAPDDEAMALNLRFDVPGTFEIDTPLARLAMRGELRVVGTTARYGVLGRLEALPGGELELTGVRYEVDHLTVTFSNPERFDPFFDISARANVQTFAINVGLLGTLDRMTPTFSSNPPLPEMDIISLISVGRRADEAASGQAGAVASSFFSDQLTGVVTKRARRLLDLDQLRVDPFAATDSGSPTARLTMVKQLSRDWTVTVSTNLNANSQEIITSRWRLGTGVYLEAIRDVDGSYAMDVKWQHRY